MSARILFYLFLLSPTTALPSPTYAFVTVPFEDININPNEAIQANYSFGNHAIIFCFDSKFQTVGNIQWPYKGQTKNSSLPISLKTSEKFTGQFADTNGTIKIINTTTSILTINCQFGF